METTYRFLGSHSSYANRSYSIFASWIFRHRHPKHFIVKINDITNALDENFYISGWVLLPVLIVMGLAIKKYPPLPSLFAGVVAGGATEMIVQGESLQSIFNFAN